MTAALAANLPFMTQRLLAVWPLPNGKGLAVRLGELVVLYFLVGILGLALERQAGQIVAQGDDVLSPLLGQRVCALVHGGGYPEVIGRKDATRRVAWYRSYISSILQRDVRDISHVTGLTDLPRLLTALAVRSSGLLNVSDISRTMDLPHTTLRRYLALLEATFLSTPLPAWSGHRGRRLTKASKLHLADSGFAAHLCGIVTPAQLLASLSFGNLLETFVVNELRKQATWNRVSVQIHHFRTESGREVDIVLEDMRGRITGIEVKAAEAVSASDFKGLYELKDIAGDKWTRGIILHSGKHTVPFQKDMHAVPLSALWEW